MKLLTLMLFCSLLRGTMQQNPGGGASIPNPLGKFPFCTMCGGDVERLEGTNAGKPHQ